MRVEKLLKRLRREFIKVNLIQAFLDSLTAFLAVNLVLFILNITLVSDFLHYRILAASAFIFLLADWVYRSRKYRLEIYEEENPQLREILRTARDNLDSQNVVSQAMFDDLMQRARSVTSESIIPGAEIIKKIVLIGVLSFLTALSGLTDFQPVQESREVFSQLQPEDILNPEPEQLKNGSEIYGEAKDIQGSATDLEINVTGDASGGSDGSGGSGASEDFVFRSSDPSMPEDVELARRYSLAIRDSG
ncbi:DUF7502 family protein [Candidatus Nanohalobium constans]|uniref:Uncharacterized protein n=1 Tax=Candidatus Nanohalobium constans TaxID=2565781 RepID=A0A5Q0UHL4_9ARCH|nr:hypothetical protein [Candidatus Nanohalobium constans]QGA80690.1 hypothetical protein LC1Nh_0806 [Candidatus Nanohalobium constans]